MLLAVLLNGSAWGNEEKAEFSLHLFQNGLPVADAELLITSESFEKSSAILIFESTPSSYAWKPPGDAPLKTNDSGSLAGKLPPGQYQFTIQTTDGQQFTFDMPLSAAENAQILVTFYAGKKKPLLNIESSAAGTLAGTDAVVAGAREQGEGLISVQVLSVETQKPLKDVQVFLSGLKEKLRTDDQGRVTATVPAGSYSVSLLHSAYSSQTQDGVQIADSQTTELSFKLTPAGVELAEYVVLEPHLAGTIASIMEEQRTATSVATVLGAEQFSRSGDGDVASALRRASGLTLVGGQYIFIRGLGERFSTTLVNGAAIPSPDPTRRVVPLDLFPTNILESVMVQKSYSPDRPAEFAGGTLEMRTRGIPDAFFFNLNLQAGVNDNTTFQDGLTYKGGGLDFTSYDDGSRALPDSIADATADGRPLQQQTPFNPRGATPAQIERFGEDLSDVWNINKRTRGPDTGMQASMGDRFTFGDFTVGYIGALGWKQEFRNQNEINREFAITDGELVKKTDFDVKRSLREVHVTAYGGTELQFRDTHRLFARTMFLRQMFDEARTDQGFTDAETFDIRRSKLKFFSNELLMTQVGGEHRADWLKDFTLNWLFTDATANRVEPKTRDYRFDDTGGGGRFSFSRQIDSNRTMYSNLVDRDQSWRVDGKLPLEPNFNHKIALIGGMITQQKTRDSEIRSFNFYPAGPDGRNNAILGQSSLENILNRNYIGPNGFQLREGTRASDSYNASQSLLSYYGKLDWTFYDRLNISGGLRWEDNNQKVNTFTGSGNALTPTVAGLNRIDMLPSVTTTLFISDKQQLRAGFSQSLSRPDFRELSVAPFTDMNINQEVIGNPNLKQTSITNWDARWEYYLSPSENIFAGFFWKDLTNPIELVTQVGSGVLNTYQNTDKANLYGFELELLKKLDDVHPLLQNFYVGGNYTWSKSNVKLSQENLASLSTPERPLQGHSSHIVNFQFGYDNPATKTQATLLYNVASKRIVSAGLLGTPDKYEQPFHQLDFVISQHLYKRLSGQLTMQNLLDDDVLIMQGDEISRQFRRGRFFNLSVRFAY